MTVQVRLFARYAELFGSDSLQIELPDPSTAGDAVDRIRGLWPGGSALPDEPLVAINMKHASISDAVQDGDEIAILPPLAGG